MVAPRRFRWGFVVLAIVLAGLIAWLTLAHKPVQAKPERVGASRRLVELAQRQEQSIELGGRQLSQCIGLIFSGWAAE